MYWILRGLRDSNIHLARLVVLIVIETFCWWAWSPVVQIYLFDPFCVDWQTLVFRALFCGTQASGATQPLRHPAQRL